jgi:hypothetical protein
MESGRNPEQIPPARALESELVSVADSAPTVLPEAKNYQNAVSDSVGEPTDHSR